MDTKYGTSKSIPQLVMAGASCDDIFVIVLFSTFVSMAQGGSAHLMDFLSIPISIVLGIILGAIVGFLLSLFFETAYAHKHCVRNSMKVIIVLGISFLLMAIETWTCLLYTSWDTAHAVMFDKTTGATYSIFEGQDGVSVQDHSIMVGDQAKQVKILAEPDYKSNQLLRKEFNADQPIQSARLYITSRGIYEPYVNGERIGEDWFNPGFTQYNKTITYSTYDITDQLQQGTNAIGEMCIRDREWLKYILFWILPVREPRSMTSYQAAR